MITYMVGDLFTSPAKVLVNPVNTVGVMGKGIAKDFKRIYPEMFEKYQYFCEQGMFNVGQLWLYKAPHKWILNFPTKKHWRDKSKIEYLEAGLQKFADTYDSKGMLEVSFPMLGCGHGGLDWEKEVQPLMEKYLQPLPINVYIHVLSFRKGAISLLHGRTSTIRQESRSDKISYNPKSDLLDKKETGAAARPAKKTAESAPKTTYFTTYLTKEDEAELRRKLKELEGQYDALTQELKDRNTDHHHRYHMEERLSLVAGQIGHIQGTLNRATIVEDNGPSDEVRIGSTVVIREDGTNEDEEYKIAGVAKTSEGKISHKSPIGAVLLGKKKGQKVKIKTPGGAVKFKIVDVR